MRGLTVCRDEGAPSAPQRHSHPGDCHQGCCEGVCGVGGVTECV